MTTPLIETIVREEWQMFDRVQNQGGRASCQDDWDTFSIMRSSQLSAWAEDTLQFYLEDLLTAKNAGRNLLQEKYAYMMESTVPEEFARIRHLLPEVDSERRQLIDTLAAIQIGEMEDLAKHYPHVAATMRPLRSCFDTPWCTSLETYLKGELCTYSLQTLQAYQAQLQNPDLNYSYAVLNQTALQYGCSSLEELEKLLQSK